MKQAIKTAKAPAAIGAYSQGVQAGGLVFVSGQLGTDPQTGSFTGETAGQQAEQALKNIQAILAEAGLGMQDVVKATVYIKDMDDFAEMNAAYAAYFEAPYPARAAVEVARLPKDALVEIEAIAYKG